MFSKYSEILNSTTTSCGVRIIHEFLSIEEESRLECLTLYSHTPSLESIDTLLSLYEPSHDGPYHRSAVIMSVGSSSTQVYGYQRVLALENIGAEAIERDPALMETLMTSILKQIRDKSISLSSMIICNSISYFVSKTVRLDKIDEAGIIDVNDRVDRQSTLYSNTLQALKSLCSIAESMKVLTVLTASHEWKLNNKWLRTKAKECLTPGDVGNYMVDFGGGGLDMYYYNPETSELVSIGKNRFLLGHQKEFLQCIRDGNMDHYISIISLAIDENITTHAKLLNIHPVRCYIFQTGQAREAYFNQS